VEIEVLSILASFIFDFSFIVYYTDFCTLPELDRERDREESSTWMNEAEPESGCPGLILIMEGLEERPRRICKENHGRNEEIYHDCNGHHA